jgi:AcrR family transcriptional regulator
MTVQSLIVKRKSVGEVFMTSEHSGRRRRKEARPGEILEAATELFGAQGYASTTMEAIAARAGIAKGTVYRYYATKEALFEAMVRSSIAPIFSKLARLPDEDEVPTPRLLQTLMETLYRALIHSRERRIVMKLLIAEGAQFPHLVQFYHSEILSGAEALLHRLVRRGIDRGEFRNSAIALEPKVLIGPMVMAAVWEMTFQSVAPLNEPQFIAAHVDMVLHGLLDDQARMSRAT